MVSYVEDLTDKVKQGLCNVTRTAGATAALGSRFWGSVGYRGGEQTSRQAAQLWSNASGIFCNRQRNDTDPEFTDPFTGGQCPGQLYTFRRQGVIDGTPFGSISFATAPGPIRVVTEAIEPQGSRSVVLTGDGERLPCAATTFPDRTTDCQITDVQTADGSPDVCGNPPPTGPDYNPQDFTFPTTINYDDEDGAPQSEPVDIVYRPVEPGPNLDFTVPFQVNFNDGSSIFGDVNITTGDINIGPGNQGGDGLQPEPRELEENEDPPPGTKIVGVRVFSQFSSLKEAGLTELFSSDGGENIYVPRLGSVLFKFEGDAGQGESQTEDFKTLDSVIYSEKPATSARIFSRQGVTTTFRYLVVPCSSLCCQN